MKDGLAAGPPFMTGSNTDALRAAGEDHSNFMLSFLFSECLT